MTNNSNNIDIINTTNNNAQQIKAEFVESLGFDPSDLNALSQNINDFTFDAPEKVQELMLKQKEMNEILLKNFERNLQALKQYMGNIYEQFKAYKPSETLEFICTLNGIANLFYPEKNEFLYKCYNPYDMCKKQVDLVLEHSEYSQFIYTDTTDHVGQIQHRYLKEILNLQKQRLQELNHNKKASPKQIKSCPIALLLGVGLGYHIEYLCSQIDIGNIIIIEPNLDLFYASLYTANWAEIIEKYNTQHRGICFILGQDQEQTFYALESYYAKHGRMLTGFLWSLMHYKSVELEDIANNLMKNYKKTFAGLGFFDDALFGFSHGCYMATHHGKFIVNDIHLDAKYKNLPVCVVGNGPSLSNDIAFLRKIQDKAIIIACGTAIESLYIAGVKPDFYACHERLQNINKHLSLIKDKEFLQDCILLTVNVVHPKILSYFKDVAIFSKYDEVFYWFYMSRFPQIGKRLQCITAMNPLVGNFALAACVFLNFKNIYLFGIDNGTKDLNNFHAKENLSYTVFDFNLKKHQNQCNTLVDGNFGGKIHSSFLYTFSILNMEYIIKLAQQANIFCFNCSDGALIQGAISMHSQDLAWWENLADIDKQGLKEAISSKTIDLNLSEEQIKQLVNPQEFKIVIDKVIEKLSTPQRPQNRLEFVSLMQYICEIFNTFSNSPLQYVVRMIAGSIYTYFITLLHSLYILADEKEALKLTEECVQKILYFLEDSKKLIDFAPYYYAEEHVKYLNGKIGFDHEDSQAPDIEGEVERLLQNKNMELTKEIPEKFIKRYE